MNGETKCNCQFCNEHISFPTEMAGQTVVCPHCGLETKLFIPPIPENRKPAELEQSKLQPTTEKSEESNVVTLSYVFSFLLPIVGFFFGVYLMAKRKAGHGAACMALSIVMGVVWFQVFSLKNSHSESKVDFLAKYSDLQIDEILHPAQGAYGWSLGDKLPYNFDVSTNDGEITYYSSYSETNGFDGWLKLTEDRRIASITQCFHNESNQIDELMKVLKEKYGLRRISGNYATFGTTNRQVTFYGESTTSFLEYRDVELCQIIETEKEKIKNSAEDEKKKHIENDLKTHL